ncbi:tetratricopeptide repeat protein [Capnocytophaga felis]|uniref:Tetratricopeptide repeat protein n=1 Tax=Capnocytophaga felis TaxID=2267611 RepID=A0A5M4B8Y2_9FLAO|nr:hypothetical protein [Capnocytophaga felis]GET46071.1 hypothetical protein RCZ01_13730 [Capnocytophaga felis]GET48863.1 hypothetical protein RCZ02_16940 [Capnocytophaga felis]
MTKEQFITQYEKAIKLRDTNNTQDAITLFRGILSEMEKNPEILTDDEVVLTEYGTLICKALLYSEFACALDDSGDLKGALQMEGRALEQLSKMKNRDYLGIIYFNYSDYSMQSGDFQEALSVLQKGIDDIEKEDFKQRIEIITGIYINTGLCNYFLGNKNEAEKYLEIAVDYLRTAKEELNFVYEEIDQDYFEVNYFLSEIHKEKGNDSDYERYRNETIEITSFISNDDVEYFTTIYPDEIKQKLKEFYSNNK